MKQAHVYIYGVIDYWQDDNANEWGYVNLKSVKNQIDSQEGYDEILVHIHSDGGVVSEGFAIHDYLRSLGKPITTQIEGNCFSIATVIALAGDKRIMTTNAEFLIHNPWGFVGGEKDDVQKYADELGRLEDKAAELYAAKTNLSKEEALELMKVETTFTAEEALEKGFITEILTVMRAVALYNPDKKQIKNKSDMLTKKEADKKFNSLGNTLNKIMDKLTGNDKPKALLVQDANGVEIDFPDVETDAEPQVGDKANVDGNPADGEYIMPSGDTYVFVSGELTEIKTETEEDDSEEVEALKADNETLKAENLKLKGDVDNAIDSIKNLKVTIEDVKKEISSSFNYKPEIDGNKKPEGDGEKTRNLFKKD